MISIDETSWRKVMNKQKSWSLKGQADRVRDARGGTLITLLAASSCKRIELFMLVEGGVTAPIWCFFISEL